MKVALIFPFAFLALNSARQELFSLPPLCGACWNEGHCASLGTLRNPVPLRCPSLSSASQRCDCQAGECHQVTLSRVTVTRCQNIC